MCIIIINIVNCVSPYNKHFIVKSSSLFFPVMFLLLFQFFQFAKADTEDTGDVLSYLIPAIALGETIFYEEGHEGSVAFLKAFVTSRLLTEGLKASIDKRRPDGDCCDSFPSGHSSRAFVGASFIHKRYGFKYSIPAYLAASYVAYSRVEANRHEVEDVIAGGAIGILSSYLFVKPYKGFHITPTVQNGAYEVTISKKF